MLEVHSAKDGAVIGRREIGGTNSLEYSPDGSFLLAGNLLLDAKDLRRVVARLGSDDIAHVCGAISPNNEQVLTGHADGYVRLWDVSTSKLLRKLGSHQSRVHRVCFGPKGRQIASVGDGTVRVGDLSDPLASKLSMLGTHDGFIIHVAFSDDGRTLATSGDGLYLWNPNSASSTANFVIENVGGKAIASSPDGQHLVAAGSDATVRVWEVATGQEQRWFECNGPVSHVSYSPDGSTIAAVVSTNKRYEIVLLNALTGEVTKRWPAHDQWIYHLEYSPDGNLLGTASVDRTVRIWETSTGQEQYELPGLPSVYGEIAFSPNGRLVATCAHGVTISEARTGKRLRHLDEAAAQSSLPQTVHDLRAVPRKGIMLVDIDSGESTRPILESIGNQDRFAFSPDGKRMWTVLRDSALTVIDWQANEHLATFETRFDALDSLTVSPDGKTVATGTSDGHAVLWEVGDRSHLASERRLVSRARRLVDDLFEELTFSAAVAAAIRDNASLDESVRRTALHIVAVRGDNAYRLNNTAQKIVRSSESTDDDHGLALKMAQVATAKMPDRAAYLSTLGIAH